MSGLYDPRGLQNPPPDQGTAMRGNRGDSYKPRDEMNTKPPFEDRAMQRLKDVDDAARFRWLCQNPDWHFIELLCQEFVAESSEEFYQGLCAAIDKHRRMEASADSLRDQINAAMGGRQPTPWSGSK